ncbi:Tetratricopeptide repeat protein 23 [Dissostichus eleginoides]|uniref:Tetratricopeptide repeat protein 23 n=1 Tax=Dissostichus eleginoides TaxID=100907 RepID=A0AAD9BU58_DISEL|nr:Tetratricopeptide repeat protein 23 [Dissostichus eleginoides]
MMAPEEKLKHFNRRAQACEDNQEFDACIQDLVRCVALTRLVYGDGHLKLAQAHARLAQAYVQFNGWGLQAQEHSALARDLLPFCSSISSGREQVLEELHPQGGINQEEKMRTELEISTGLSRVYRRQNRPEDALRQCEKSLQVLKDCGTPEKTCSVYRDMAAIEQDKGHLDRAIEHLSKAHAIAMSHIPEELEGAQICHSLALLLSAAAEPRHNDSAGLYFEQSLSAYKHCAGPQDPAFLTAQDDFCRFLLLSDQQERCVEIQRASLATKRSTFGDLSAEVADTLQLIGSVEMSEGRVKQAHRTMTKCLEIQSLLYGSQHKKTKATQKAVDMLARAPEVAERQKRRGRRKTNQTQSVAPSAGNDGHSMSDS